MRDFSRISSEDLHLELFMKKEFNDYINPMLHGCPPEEIQRELLKRGFYKS